MALPNISSKEKKEADLKDVLKDYVYVFASTLNQMVNYIPIKMYSFKELYTVTLADKNLVKKIEDNQEWDENLSANISGINEIKICQLDYLKINITIDKFTKEFKDKKVFWNLTGGQRPFIMAVLEYTKDKPSDYIVYLEGNTGKLSLRQNGIDLNAVDYQLPEDANLRTAITLMGFKPQHTFDPNIKIEKEEEDFWVGTFYKKYKESLDLRKNLVQLNKEKDEKDKAIDKTACWVEIFKILNLNNIPYLETYQKSNSRFPFGYILEKMVFHIIYHMSHPKVQQVYANLNTYSDGSQIDQFDILILTKTGKIINIECKSGVMDSDVAKSTKYSTYAISGVYGKPILITPLLQNEKDEFTFNSSFKAKAAAKGADLEVWFIDTIKDELEKLLK